MLSLNSRRHWTQSLLLLGLLAAGRPGAFAEMPTRPHPARYALSPSVCAGIPQATTTSFIRQFAKDDPHTQIIVSGPQAAAMAKALSNDITSHKDYKARSGEEKVTILTLEQAEQAAQDPKFNDSTRIFLLATREMKGGLPADLTRVCPVDPTQLPEGGGVVASRNLNPRAGHLAFSMAIIAPDTGRMQDLMGVFGQPYADYKGMLSSINDKFETYRLAIFSSEADRAAVEKWGQVENKNVWAKYEWHPLSAYAGLTPEEREERHLIFFLNRRDTTQAMPEPAQALLKGQRLGEMTSVVLKGAGPNGLTCAVFSSPSELLLSKRAGQYHHFDAIPANPAIDDAADLRMVDRSVLLVHGSGVRLQPADAEVIRTETTRTMRNDLKISVEEPGAQVDALQKGIVFQDLPGAIETARQMRAKNGVRYVWLLQVTDYGGTSAYTPAQKLVSDPPPPYVTVHADDKEPVEPTRDAFAGRGKKAQYEKDKATWQPLHDAWLSRKNAYETSLQTRYPCLWECKIDKESVANVQGVLRLIDLDHPEAPLWEKACKGRRAFKTEFVKRTVEVRGTKNQPSPLPCPPNDTTCPPSLLMAAGVGTGSAGLFYLQSSALLSDGKPVVAPAQFQVAEKPADPPANTAPVGSKVAYADENGVTLKIDPAAGIQKGFWVDIPLSVVDIPDPDNPGKVLAHKVLEKVVVRVVTLRDNVAECVPVSDKEKAKMSRVKPGMLVGDSYSPPETKEPTPDTPTKSDPPVKTKPPKKTP